jgi:hypothetical protein
VGEAQLHSEDRHRLQGHRRDCELKRGVRPDVRTMNSVSVGAQFRPASYRPHYQHGDFCPRC